MSENELDSPLIPKGKVKGFSRSSSNSPQGIVEEAKGDNDFYAKLLNYANTGNIRSLRDDLNNRDCDVTKVVSASGETILHAALQGDRTKIVDFAINNVSLVPAFIGNSEQSTR